MVLHNMRRLLLVLLVIVSTALCKSFVIQPGVWRYKDHPIAYEQVRTVADEATGQLEAVNRDQTPVLLLNGFGVGSFHQHRLISSMMESGEEVDNSTRGGSDADNAIYTIDYLGQGKSWPEGCDDGTSPSEEGLRYCGFTWVDQIIEFIEHVIQPQHGTGKIHIVGNSVGGHLAVFIAAARPDLVESICLLNATPVWGLNLPGWSGHLPAPKIPRLVGRYLFDRIRDLDIIEKYLDNAYANRDAFDQTLMQQIRSCTDGQGGHAAFASILWSPPITVPLSNGEAGSFDACLESLECDVLLLFGGDDPWCKPAFAKRMLKSLSKRPDKNIHRYIELSNVGHCPNHEAPTAVARVLQPWLQATNRRPDQLSLLQADTEVVHESWGQTLARERGESEILLSTMDRLATTFV
jgi:pimeloyl-ACP methyl ester carboxylesterase